MKILIVGDIFIDTHTDISEKKVNRIGGIFHAIRGLSAFDVDSSLIYCATEFMNEYIDKYKQQLNIAEAYHCFKRTGSPGIFIIDHSNELHDNRYEYILPEEERVEFIPDSMTSINFEEITDVLVFPGTYDLEHVLNLLKKHNIKIHIDMQYEDLDKISPYDIETLFISISSTKIQKQIENYLHQNNNWTTAVLKENRGGSKVLTSSGETYQIPSFLLGSIHSVGVGDVYNATYLCHKNRGFNTEESLLKASYAAALYSNTLHFEKFQESLQVLDGYVPSKVNGVRVSYENRGNIHIYVAGPDFNNSQYTAYFDKIIEIFHYHNFSGHLPIRENGNGDGKNQIEQADMYAKDLQLLDKCQIMIACGFENDAGTMAEIGYFKANNKPVILFDPKNEVTNMFVRHTVNKTVNSLDKLLETVYRLSQEILRAKI